MNIYLPFWDTLISGTPGGTLINNMRYVVYSHPIAEPWILSGFNVNFNPSGVSVSMAAKTDRHVWSPFFHTNLHAVAGRFSDVEPVLRMPRAHEILPYTRIQIAIENQSGENIENCLLTLVGVRVFASEVLCTTLKGGIYKDAAA